MQEQSASKLKSNNIGISLEAPSEVSEYVGDGHIVNLAREEDEAPVRIPSSISAKLKPHQVCFFKYTEQQYCSFTLKITFSLKLYTEHCNVSSCVETSNRKSDMRLNFPFLFLLLNWLITCLTFMCQYCITITLVMISVQLYLYCYRKLKYIMIFQVSGIRFMWENVIQSVKKVKSGDKGFGCILAHNMGLGKTFQVCTDFCPVIYILDFFIT